MRRSFALCVLTLLTVVPAIAQPTPLPLDGLDYDVAFFPGTTYDPSIPTLEALVGFRPGDRAAFPAEIERVLEAWSAASPRAELVEYARSHEGRALYYVIVSSPENISRLEEIRQGLGKLADPRVLDREEADRLVASLPVTAWLAYSIHGDETSGTDGALAVLYHLIAGTSADVTDILDDLVILVDPMMNPDGRHRFLQQIAEHRATTPNVDSQSLLHSGYWPWGRGNHYLFDLNRDWLPAVNPESRGRIREAASWHPLLFVDAHEMGPLDTYLFSPAREPRNPHIPPRRKHWNSVFARDQSEAFDHYNWLYYTGEWNEGWYPGYSDAWAEYRGAIGILYEQAGYAEDAVRTPAGTLATYREAVHHQAVSSLSNLRSLRQNARQLLEEFAAERRRSVAVDGPYADRTFAVLPTANASRQQRLLDLLDLHGIEVHVATEEIVARSGFDQLGQRFARRTLPAGTLLIPNRQPEAPLTATFLEFDTRMTDDYLARERKTLLREGRSSIYDLTAWNLTMLFGLEAVTLDGDLPEGTTPWSREVAAAAVPAPDPEQRIVAWTVDGVDDDSVAVAARLMEQGLRVRVASRAFELAGANLSRGSVVVLPADNPSHDELGPAVVRTAADLGLHANPVTTGLGDGDLPDLGGDHFTLLEAPRIAIASRGDYRTTDFGSIWHTLDHRVGIRHSHLEADGLDYADLRRYNVLVLPDRWSGSLDHRSREALEAWIEAGGTLIAIGRSAGDLTSGETPVSRVRRLESVLADLDEYELAVFRQWMAENDSSASTTAVWTHAAPQEVDYPWSPVAQLSRPAKEELERRDRWQRTFMPQGAFLAARADQEHWLTFGTAEVLPILYGTSQVLMAGDAVEAPIRFGAFIDNPQAEAGRVGWGPVPAGHRLYLRMSGLLWPEATQRIANAPYVTRERRGDGQIILFADSPSFRAATQGTIRLLLNALIYGPGFGARHAIEP